MKTDFEIIDDYHNLMKYIDINCKNKRYWKYRSFCTIKDNKGKDCNRKFKCISHNNFTDDEFKTLFKIVKENRLTKERLVKIKNLLGDV